jgi:two-component system OmpR family sensor kinase
MATDRPVSHAPSIRRRLARTAVAGVLLAALASAAVAAWAVSLVVQALMKSALEETAQALVVLAEYEQDVAALAQGRALPASPHEEALTWQLRASDGSLVARSHGAPAQPWPVPLFEGHQQAIGLAVFTIAGERLWLQVAQPLASLRAAQRRAALQAGGAVLALSIVAALVLAWRIGRELRPVAQLAADVAAIDPAPVAPRLPRSPRRELEPVYAALEGLLQRLALKLRNERAFAAHAAHSLRTPLAGLSAQLELARTQAPPALQPRLETAHDAARRLGGVVEALLTMARASGAPQWRRFAPRLLLPVALARRIEVDAAHFGDAPELDGDADLLAVAVANLVDNAVRHGASHVRLAARRDTQSQRIEVADDGPGVDAGRLNVLREALERFDRKGEVDGSLGLGLTLAASVARAHGGSVDLDCDGRPQAGFCVRLRWPPGAGEDGTGTSVA